MAKLTAPWSADRNAHVDRASFGATLDHHLALGELRALEAIDQLDPAADDWVGPMVSRLRAEPTQYELLRIPARPALPALELSAALHRVLATDPSAPASSAEAVLAEARMRCLVQALVTVGDRIRSQGNHEG